MRLFDEVDIRLYLRCQAMLRILPHISSGLKMHTDTIEVCIEGSTGVPYVATFFREGDLLRTSCNCPAGEKRIHCKHRLTLFSGNLSAVRGITQSGLAEQLSAMVRGTQVAAALQELEIAELEAKTASERVRHAKKNLDRVMHK